MTRGCNSRPLLPAPSRGHPTPCRSAFCTWRPGGKVTPSSRCSTLSNMQGSGCWGRGARPVTGPSARWPQGLRRSPCPLPASGRSKPSAHGPSPGVPQDALPPCCPRGGGSWQARASPLTGAQDVQDVGEEVVVLGLRHGRPQLSGLQELGHQDAQAVLVRELRREDLKDGLAGTRASSCQGHRSPRGHGQGAGQAGPGPSDQTWGEAVSPALGTRAPRLRTRSGSASCGL